MNIFSHYKYLNIYKIVDLKKVMDSNINIMQY